VAGGVREREGNKPRKRKKLKRKKKETSSERHKQSPERDPKMVEERVL